ncbi:MAG: hypothetical protein DRJ42_03750 [Deltaproteobacteria bacterium]|nr:MAG: hypothetical protein DRJ42_03750 [Deltaproteobacteria bacterium]
MWPISTETPGESRAAIRLAVGVTVAAAVVLLLDVSVPAMLPLFVGVLLRPGTKPLPLKVAVILVLITYFAFSLGRYATDILLVSPGILLLVSTWLIYICYYANAAGVHSVIVTLSLLAVLTVPFAGTVSLSVADVLARSMTILIGASVAISFLVHGLLPAQAGEVAPVPGAHGLKESPLGCHRRALKTTLVVAPVAWGYFFFGSFDYVMALIYIGLVMLTANPDEGATKGQNWIAANTLAGFVSVVLVLVGMVVDSPVFAMLVLFLVALMFGRSMAANARMRGPLGDAFSAILLVVTSENAIVEVTTRLTQILLVIAYAALMFNALGPGRVPTRTRVA